MVLGRPIFDASAPRLRVRGRKLSNIGPTSRRSGAGVDDSLYGFRVYRSRRSIAVMQRAALDAPLRLRHRAVVRLAWRGVTPFNIAAPVKYLTAAEGGVSHFRYCRDNVLLTWMHARLLLGFAFRLPWLALRRALGRPPFAGRR
jgi:hypothetical protein